MKLLLPSDIRATVRKKFASGHRGWLAQPCAWPQSLLLGSLTEKEVAPNTQAIRDWVSAWERAPLAGEVLWTTRNWPRLGEQRLPDRINYASPEQLAGDAGQGARWATAVQRHALLCARWPQLAGPSALPRYFDELADYPEADFARLVSLLAWLADHPNSNHYVRQLPVPGLDTKWIGGGTRKGLVTDLMRDLRGMPATAGFYEVCGLRKPAHRLRLRVLCPTLRSALGGLCDIEAPLAEIANLPLRPTSALIVENLETGLALPDQPGLVAFVKLGNAVSVLADIPWLTSIPARYWGDLDTYGFAILARARKALPQLTSILMDEATLLQHKSLWVEEAKQAPAVEVDYLTAPERAAYDLLATNALGLNVRLEQERISWPEALSLLLRPI